MHKKHQKEIKNTMVSKNTSRGK